MIAIDSRNPPGMGYGTGKLGLPPETEVVETVGRMIEFWGFKRALGRVWAHLYLSPEPLNTSEIADALSINPPALAAALDELQVWGVVRRIHRPGDRKEYFSADEDVWKLVTRVLSDRELREIENAYDTFARAEQFCRQQGNDRRIRAPQEPLQRGSDFRRERISNLRKVTATGKALLQGLVLTSKVESASAPVQTSPRRCR